MGHVPGCGPVDVRTMDEFDPKAEAELFASTMEELEPQLRLDFSLESLRRVDSMIAREYDSDEAFPAESLIVGVGCYVGETIRRAYGGDWHDEDAAVVEIGQIAAIYPIQKAAKRFRFGPAESLSLYADTVRRHAVPAA